MYLSFGLNKIISNFLVISSYEWKQRSKEIVIYYVQMNLLSRVHTYTELLITKSELYTKWQRMNLHLTYTDYWKRAIHQMTKNEFTLNVSINMHVGLPHWSWEHLWCLPNSNLLQNLTAVPHVQYWVFVDVNHATTHLNYHPKIRP